VTRAPSHRARPAPTDRPSGDNRRRRDRRKPPRAHRVRRLYVIPLPPLGAGELVAWRLDQAVFAATWDDGEGAFRAGGRWNSRGVRAVYTSLDPDTAILEVAVHKGFAALDTVAHVLTAATVLDPSKIHIVEPEHVPNPNWLRPGIPGAGQQAFGDTLLARHQFVLIPSAVSTHSWNLIFVASVAAGIYAPRLQEPFALDTRLHPAV
jgi:RES domain-containing protein